VQLLHVVDKSEKFIDELLHTDIRLKCAAINDRAVDFGAARCRAPRDPRHKHARSRHPR
jgi:hypothetical protein